MLESEKNRLEVVVGESEDTLAEAERTEEANKARIGELETVIAATESKVNVHLIILNLPDNKILSKNIRVFWSIILFIHFII